MKKEAKKEANEENWFKWVPSAATDVMATWKRFGFVPPSEDPKYQRKWAEWKARFNNPEPEPEPARVASVSPLRPAR